MKKELDISKKLYEDFSDDEKEGKVENEEDDEDISNEKDN